MEGVLMNGIVISWIYCKGPESTHFYPPQWKGPSESAIIKALKMQVDMEAQSYSPSWTQTCLSPPASDTLSVEITRMNHHRIFILWQLNLISLWEISLLWKTD